MSSAHFPLIEDAEEDPGTAGVGAPLLAPVELRAGLGYGLLTPFRRDRKSDFASGGDAALVRANISQVLGVRSDDGRMTGEVPWRNNFGSLLEKLRFMPLDETYLALARTYVSQAIARWEPRARVRRVQALRYRRPDDGSEQVVLRVSYDIVQSGTSNILAANQNLDVPVAA